MKTKDTTPTSVDEKIAHILATEHHKFGKRTKGEFHEDIQFESYSQECKQLSRLIQIEVLKGQRDEAYMALGMEAITGTDTGFVEGMNERIATLTEQLQELENL